MIALMKEEEAIIERLGECEEVFVPSIVVGELYFGASKSERAAVNQQRVDEFAAGSAVLPCDGETGRYYGIIKESLRAKGRPIPDNDIWIAAIAPQHDLVLASRDQHFVDIDDLHLEAW